MKYRYMRLKIREKKQSEEIKNINIGSKPLKKINFFRTISDKAKKNNG